MATEVRALNIMKIENLVVQRKKDEAKLCMAQLAEKRIKESMAAEAQEVQDAA